MKIDQETLKILNSYRDNRTKIVVEGANGLGQTFTIECAVLRWGDISEGCITVWNGQIYKNRAHLIPLYTGFAEAKNKGTIDIFYIKSILTKRYNAKKLKLKDNGVIVTPKVAERFELEIGDEFIIESLSNKGKLNNNPLINCELISPSIS